MRLKGRWFFIVPFVLLMLWFLVNLTFSPCIYSYILGHYEINQTPSYTHGSAPMGLVWVANNVTEVLARAALVVGLMIFASASISYLAYRAAKNP